MAQLRTLIWLKWKLFRNSLRSSKAVVNRIASILGMLAALALALLIALGLGAAAYALTSPHGMMDVLQRKGGTSESNTSIEFIFFTILAFSYLVWATLPLSIGSSKQFDPGRMLMYPISLRKLFAIDFVSELATLQSIFSVPGILALGIGAGLGTGEMTRALLVTIPAAAFGLALSKWLATVIGYLTRGKRTRGETLVAIIGAVVGLGGALLGQIAPVIFKHAASVKGLRWTPPGAAAFALTTGLKQDPLGYVLALATLGAYTIVLVIATYWIARRAALGLEGRRRGPAAAATVKDKNYSGWELPLLSPHISAVVEKELRYIMRNAQIRMMALMPLILIVVRIMNTNRFSKTAPGPGHNVSFAQDFLIYGKGLMATGGVLYVFLILAGLSCNLFAFEEGGMRALILSPVARRDVLFGKNIAITTVAAVFSVFLLIINEIVFRDLTQGAVLFIGLSFITFAALMAMIGNWLSMRFPKRMQFGKRLNVSGVVGLLVIPMVLVLALPPLAATAAGYIAQSLTVEYATLALLAAFTLGSYFLVISAQGESLQRREVEILEAVREPQDE